DYVALVTPGPAVRVVAAADGEAEPVAWLDLTRRAFRLHGVEGVGDVEGVDGGGVRGVRPSSDGGAPVAPGVFHGVLERASVGLAAELCGVGRWLLDASVEYAKQREQFGRPIGSYQAIQHKLADMVVELERAVAAVYYAAMVVDADDPDRRRAVHVAKAAAGTAAVRCARDGIQVHGGIGYTWDHDLHLYLRRAYSGEHLLGTTAWHHDRLAELLFDRAG
ncbi:MAG: acyl-CoA dehydrogenase family protein, partial [Acidimicrobiales bacterium]